MNKFTFNRNDQPAALLQNAKKAVSMCEEITPKSGMLFFVSPVQNILHMPSNAMVELIYMPTYTIAAYLINCKMHLKDLFTQDRELEAGFKGILLACTGRSMTGYGYEVLDGLVDALEIFLEAPLKAFLSEYGTQYPEFAKCTRNAIQTLYATAKGKANSPWGPNEKLVIRAQELVAVWEASKDTAD